MAKLAPITIPTEPNDSIPRPLDLIDRVAKSDSEDPNLAPFHEDAIRETVERFEATGSPVVNTETGSAVFVGVTAPVDPILPPRKECATVRSNPARIGAGARERLISN